MAKPDAKLPPKSRNKGGRPRSFDALKQHERLRQLVFERQDVMTRAQIAAAEGVKYLVARHKSGGKFRHLTEQGAKLILSGKDSEHEIVEEWEKLPSTQAFTYLMDRAFGRPKEELDANVNLSASGDLMALLLEGRQRAAKGKR